MSVTRLRALLAITIFAVGVALWLARSDPMRAAATDAGDADVALFAGRVGDVATVRVETPAYGLSLQRRGEAWVARDHGDFPARAQSVANLLASLAAMRLEARKTRMPAHYSELGVADRLAGATSRLISIENADGASAGAWLFGKRSNSASFDQTGATFVRRPGESQVWLAQGAPNFPAEFSGWFGELPAIGATEVVRIDVREAGNLVFAATRDAEGRFARSDATTPAANDTNVKRIAQALVGAGFDDVQADTNGAVARRNVRLEFAAEAVEIDVVDIAGAAYVRFSGEAASEPMAKFLSATHGYVFRLPDYKMSGLQQPVAALTASEASGAPAPESAPDAAPSRN